MVTEILRETGIQFRKARFLKPPSGTYAVYTEDIETLGGDNLVGAYHHQITIELYENGPDDNAEETGFSAASRFWNSVCITHLLRHALNK